MVASGAGSGRAGTMLFSASASVIVERLAASACLVKLQTMAQAGGPGQPALNGCPVGGPACKIREQHIAQPVGDRLRGHLHVVVTWLPATECPAFGVSPRGVVCRQDGGGIAKRAARHRQAPGDKAASTP